MKRALVSVSDKTGLVPFVKRLIGCGYEIVSTGGTKKMLESNAIPCVGIEEVTGFPEILDGRVKTLHPKVHGGLLAVRNNPEHCAALKQNEIDFIDMVVVNLYPFRQTILKPDCTRQDAIENIDIGGPSMLRSAAKNHEFVTVVTDAADYDRVATEIEQNGDTSYELRKALAAKVFRLTASYDAMIAEYLTEEEFPEKLTLTYDLVQTLRYGENPHQKAAFYRSYRKEPYSLANAVQKNGKELSYNNIQDANAALEIIRDYTEPTAVAVKHMNPCGLASADTVEKAFEKAYEGDPVSIFGGIVVLNRPVEKALAARLTELFLEIVVAPSFSEEALQVLREKPNLRVLECDFVAAAQADFRCVSVTGGLLLQESDVSTETELTCEVVTKVKPTEQEWQDLLFLQKAVKHVKSNAIVVGRDRQVLGVGAGQMNRVGSAELALKQASAHGGALLLASDAYFPFKDVVELAHRYGVKAIIQPGGSKRDMESVEKCDEYGIAMVFTHIRHFKH